MGIDAGFDMVPPLSKGAADRQKWQSFIETIKERYQDDERVEIKSNYIEFNAGEHPLLPFEGHKLLRFSAKISGSHAQGVEEYLETVARIARKYFGSRVRYWMDGIDELESGYYYEWPEVLASIDSYETPDEPETPTKTPA